MDRFGPNRFGSSEDPWFRVGDFPVTTSAFVAGFGVLMMFVWAAEGSGGPVWENLAYLPNTVSEGEVWRIVTWPIPNRPDFWTFIMLAIFYLLGSQLEALMGRRPFAWFLGTLTVVPALALTVAELLFDITGGVWGLNFVEMGVFVAFVANYPTARFWPGVPGWVLGAVFVGLRFLGLVADRNSFGLVLLFATVATALVMLRSMGYAHELQQIPRVPLPSAMTGGSATPVRQKRQRRGRGRGRGDLRAVPSAPPPPRRTVQDDLADMEIDSLLDQVASEGIDSLTKEQRKRLKDHSDRLRREKDS